MKKIYIILSAVLCAHAQQPAEPTYVSTVREIEAQCARRAEGPIGFVRYQPTVPVSARTQFLASVPQAPAQVVAAQSTNSPSAAHAPTVRELEAQRARQASQATVYGRYQPILPAPVAAAQSANSPSATQVQQAAEPTNVPTVRQVQAQQSGYERSWNRNNYPRYTKRALTWINEHPAEQMAEQTGVDLVIVEKAYSYLRSHPYCKKPVNAERIRIMAEGL